MLRIIFTLYPGFELLDFSGPLQVFHDAQKCGLACEVVFCGSSESLECEQGLTFSRLLPYPAQAHKDDWFFVPGYTPEITRVPDSTTACLRNAWSQGAHVVSTCSGAFVLGKAGILDGRSCTTHWKRTKELMAAYPRAKVLDDHIFVEDGLLTTCGGVTCGIDLALFMVEQLQGPQFALKIARELNVYIRRDRDHRQKSVYIDYRNHCNPGIHLVQDWLTEHPDKPAGLVELAGIGNMSPRNLTRQFRAETGISPGAYRTLLRLERARILLNDPHLTVEAVAERCGFTDARQLRRLWKQNHGTSPRDSTGHHGPDGATLTP